MEQKQVDLKTKSLVELKAMAYDFGVIVNEYKQMLNIVNQEIINRVQETNGLAAKEPQLTETAPTNETN